MKKLNLKKNEMIIFNNIDEVDRLLKIENINYYCSFTDDKNIFLSNGFYDDDMIIISLEDYLNRQKKENSLSRYDTMILITLFLIIGFLLSFSPELFRLIYNLEIWK